ncbi:MAG: two-component sensor histidine kinase [Actinobacteria bacterium]|nr:two-component sensor histidine kinase [Actinomycetota bacterium]
MLVLSALAIVAVIWLAVRSHERARRIIELVNPALDGDASTASLGGRGVWREVGTSIAAIVSSHEQLAQELQRQQPWRRQLVDAITLPALLFDEDGYLLAANDASARSFGATDAGRLTALQALGSTALADAVALARESQRPVELDARVADDREVFGVASPVGDETLLIVSDRTAQRRLSEVRRDFVVNASHELKSPVAGIQALSDALRLTVDRDPERARELSERLSDEAERLSGLVHDLLDLRRLESDRGGDTTPVDLVAIIDDRIERVRAMADARNITVETEVPEHAVVGGVEEDLRIAIGNLLDNAVQYNHDGGHVLVTLEREGPGYRLRLQDTGIGIPKHDLERIFERFYRVDVARSRATGGTGLGLSLVRHAVERQGGRITVESLLGEGTTITVTLPVAPRDGARAGGR